MSPTPEIPPELQNDVLTLTDLIWQGFIGLLGLIGTAGVILFTRLSTKVDKMTPLETYERGQEACEKRQTAILDEVKQIRTENREDNRSVHKRMDTLYAVRRTGEKPDTNERRRDSD